MKKVISLLLALAISLFSFCALAVQDLTGDWILTLSGEGLGSGDLTVFIYEDDTYEMMYPEKYGLPPAKGTWSFDGETLNLQSETLNLSLKWDEKNHELTGETEPLGAG